MKPSSINPFARVIRYTEERSKLTPSDDGHSVLSGRIARARMQIREGLDKALRRCRADWEGRLALAFVYCKVHAKEQAEHRQRIALGLTVGIERLSYRTFLCVVVSESIGCGADWPPDQALTFLRNCAKGSADWLLKGNPQ